MTTPHFRSVMLNHLKSEAMRTCLFLFLPLLLSGQALRHAWELPFGSRQGETIYDLLEAANGYIVMAGASTAGNGDGYLLVLDPVSGNRIVEKTIGHEKNDQFRSVAPSWDGGYLLAGSTELPGSGGAEGWLVKTDENGNVEWEYHFGTGGADAFFCIEVDDAGTAWVAGEKNGKKDGDIWWLNIWKNRILWDTLIGKNQFGPVRALTRTYPAGFALAGQSARGNKVWTLRTDASGRAFAPAVLYDGSRDYIELSDLIETLDGGLALAGSKRSQGVGDLDAWLWVQAPDGNTLFDKHAGGARDDIANALFQDAQGNFYLSGITKSSRANARKFNPVVLKIDPRGALAATFPLLDGEERPAGAARMAGLHDESMALAGNPEESLKTGGALWVIKSSYAGLSAPIQAKEDVEIELLVSNAQFEDRSGGNGNGILEPGERGDVAFSLRNNSAFHLPDVRIELRDAVAVKSSGYTVWPTVYTNTLRARQIRKISIPVIGKKDLGNSRTELRGALFIKNRKVTEFTVELECKAKGAIDAKDLARVRWITRFTDTLSLTIDDKSLYIEADIIHGGKTAPKPLLVINGTHRPNSREGSGRFRETPREYGPDYTYSDNLSLETEQWQEGINSFCLAFITEEGDTLFSDTAYVRLSRRKANLHVLAIGVPHENLLFTSADARAFAAAFESQKGDSALWNEVLITQLVDTGNTTKQIIADAFAGLKEQSGGRIARRDMVLVFISSHGKMLDGRFKILPSDYNGRESRLIDYKNDILDYLDAVQCKKMLFIDACQSGAAPAGSKSDDSELSRHLNVLHSELRGIATVSSCQPDELSYEGAEWGGHGAFTAALLEAFSDTTLTDSGGPPYHANTDGDRALTLGELYGYLQRRVPALVQRKNGHAQHPHLPVRDIKMEIPVFLYKK